MLQNLDFDFSLFEDVPSPKSHNTVCRLTLAAEDRLSQNEAFHRALQGTTAFRLQVSSDGRFLRLDPNGPCNLTFTNAGVRTTILSVTCCARRDWSHPCPISCAGGRTWTAGWGSTTD